MRKKITLFHYAIIAFTISLLSFSAKAQAPIAAYDFDGTLNNAAGNTPFSGPEVYTDNRNQEANKALLFQSFTNRNTTIANVPIGTSDRSISLWYKLQTVNFVNPYPTLFSYGEAAQYKRFGFYLYGVDGITHQGYAYDHTVNSVPTALNRWYHLVVTFQGGTVKAYINNNLVMDVARPLINTGTGNFVIGGEFTGAIDDLKIYDRVLTTTEIANSYENNPPVFSNVAPSNIYVNSATISYTISNGSAISSSSIKYGTSPTTLNASMALSSGASPLSSSTTLNGLSPNTTYYYQFEATNSFATSQSQIYSFTTSTTDLIANFTFDGTLYDLTGTRLFSGIGSYNMDRNSQPSKGVAITTARTVNLPTLPIGNADRTISLWYNINNLNSLNYVNIFSYGTNAANRMFGAYLDIAASKVVFQAHTNDVTNNQNTSLNTWYHLVITLQSGVAKVYVNNVLLNTITPSLNTALSDFKIGDNFTGSIDELKIFNRALNATEVSNLYNHNTAILPVKLKYFVAKAQNNTAVLNWQTTSETNNSHFVVKHSINGVDFVSLSEVSAKSVNGANYQYIHKHPTSGINYYQLVQIDLDGTTTDLGIKTATLNLTPHTVSLFPNPTTNEANVSFAQGTFHSAKLVNVNGQVLQTTSIGKTQQTVTFNFSNYPNGVYFIKLQGNSQNSVQKVVKQ